MKISEKNYKKLTQICENLQQFSNLEGAPNYSTILDAWGLAFQYKKDQLYYLKNDWPNEVVKVINLYSDQQKKPVNFNIRAVKNYSRLQWFKILIAANWYFLTYENLKKIL